MRKTSTFDLYFSPQEKGGRYPSFGHIHVKAYGTSPRAVEAKGRSDYVLLTTECVSQIELDEQIDRLIQELEHVRVLGRGKFSKSK
jgi:hypothetical protein